MEDGLLERCAAMVSAEYVRGRGRDGGEERGADVAGDLITHPQFSVASLVCDKLVTAYHVAALEEWGGCLLPHRLE